MHIGADECQAVPRHIKSKYGVSLSCNTNFNSLPLLKALVMAFIDLANKGHMAYPPQIMKLPGQAEDRITSLPLKTNAAEDIRDTSATRYNKCVVHHCTSYRCIPVARSILTPVSSWWFIAHSHVISADPFSVSFQNSIQNRKGACALKFLFL